MGILSWLFGSHGTGRGVVIGDGEFAFPIAGVMPYQEALMHICGGRSEEGLHPHDFDCAALLIPEPSNPHDRSAVAVVVHGAQGRLSAPRRIK
jgi:hypothetical protein